MKIIQLLLAMVMIVGCQAPQKQEANTKQEVSIVAVGDNLMHQRLLDVAKKNNTYDFSRYYTNIQPYIEEASIAFVNQETVLAGEQMKYSGFPEFNTPDVMAKNLHDVGFDVVNGATNHALDKGEEGILHSIDTFRQYSDMAYIGLYDSKKERDHIKVIEKQGIKIGFLSYNQWTNDKKINKEYMINSFDEKLIKKDVENAKKACDFLIVSCHWGNEYDESPDAFQRKYAKYMADLGVDVILGTHSHTLQPVEWIEGKNHHQTLVAYSLGNFISGMMEERTQLGGMLSFDLSKEDGKVVIDNVTLTPLMNHYQVKDAQDAYNTRYGFTVYRLKDYTDDLASKHGLNGYQGISISIEKMKNIAKNMAHENINIDM